MKFLVLGGTAWLGAEVVHSALARGYEVTSLARGASGPRPTGARFVPADRDSSDAYADVAAEHWDLVVDVSRQPGQVRRAVAALSDADRYVFVSSSNVYAETDRPGTDESAALLPALTSDVMESMDDYGPAKVACENHVIAGFGPDRCLIARVGLIGGPGDVSDRCGYWPLRFAHPSGPDGAVLVPDAPDLAAQVIDVRDLAAWLVGAAATGVTGVFNAAGPTRTLAEHLDAARTVAEHTGVLAPASPAWLVAHEVEPWMGPRSLPLWLPEGWEGFNARDASAARASGLVTRPLEETLADTLRWELGRDHEGSRRAGLADADERALIDDLRR